jgi:hypothetical protein
MGAYLGSEKIPLPLLKHCEGALVISELAEKLHFTSLSTGDVLAGSTKLSNLAE